MLPLPARKSYYKNISNIFLSLQYESTGHWADHYNAHMLCC